MMGDLFAPEQLGNLFVQQPMQLMEAVSNLRQMSQTQTLAISDGVNHVTHTGMSEIPVWYQIIAQNHSLIDTLVNIICNTIEGRTVSPMSSPQLMAQVTAPPRQHPQIDAAPQERLALSTFRRGSFVVSMVAMRSSSVRRIPSRTTMRARLSTWRIQTDEWTPSFARW
ncbi:hypothetical protein M427DRAFT_385284 [Gonapodya prolifera JEL478]|uniref:Uncharacterized protein n=1 Tax=Gonapodya prolifera (strain JEL478) TaxID=1344416 RepID=A0A139A8P7_GONPJ|nr:hypothetical protein M427DRAFT_385284 [Gonapodya prolifera JEL478]|eukprot:KXS13079.1 hypothetical protein M427DRAFT_385284 [Gonapodya prolifera JEL478]